MVPVYTTTIINYFRRWLWNEHVRCISAHIFKIMEIEKFNIYSYICKLCQKKVRPFLIRFNSPRYLSEGNHTTISTFSSNIINDFEKLYPTRFLFKLLPSLKRCKNDLMAHKKCIHKITKMFHIVILWLGSTTFIQWKNLNGYMIRY